MSDGRGSLMAMFYGSSVGALEGERRRPARRRRATSTDTYQCSDGKRTDPAPSSAVYACAGEAGITTGFASRWTVRPGPACARKLAAAMERRRRTNGANHGRHRRLFRPDPRPDAAPKPSTTSRARPLSRWGGSPRPGPRRRDSPPSRERSGAAVAIGEHDREAMSDWGLGREIAALSPPRRPRRFSHRRSGWVQPRKYRVSGLLVRALPVPRSGGELMERPASGGRHLTGGRGRCVGREVLTPIFWTVMAGLSSLPGRAARRDPRRHQTAGEARMNRRAADPTMRYRCCMGGTRVALGPAGGRIDKPGHDDPIIEFKPRD